MRQCRFMNSKKCTTLVEDADDRGDYACVLARGILEISVPSSGQYWHESKTALKIKFNEKRTTYMFLMIVNEGGHFWMPEGSISHCVFYFSLRITISSH